MVCRRTLLWPICKYRLYANTVPFYIRILSLHRFWYPRRVLEPIPMDTRRRLYWLRSKTTPYQLRACLSEPRFLHL